MIIETSEGKQIFDDESFITIEMTYLAIEH